MDKHRFLQLLNNYLLETISEEETRQFFQLLEEPAYQEIFKEQVGVDLHEWQASGTVESDLGNRIKAMAAPQPVFFMKRAWLRYAAAILLFLGIGAYFYYSNKKEQPMARKETPASVLPGANKAYLTLADGTKIILDSAANGRLAQQGHVQVVKLGNGQIAYQVKDQAGDATFMNTMSTPAGGQYQVILPDGTKAWLNAASSLTYPTAFAHNKRAVTMQGEVYFEVAKDKRKPFVVNVNGKTEVQVLGTHFNINAYDNEEAIKTTLMEGSVKIVHTPSVTLTPGQQAILTTNDAQLSIRDHADLEQALAWKNGQFNFEGLDLKAVMRQLERWYDVKVQYQRPVANDVYGGKMFRNEQLADVLEILEKMGGVRFKVSGKTILVQ